MKQLRALMAWYDGRQLKERTILLVATVFFLALLFFYLLIFPLERQGKKIDNQISAINTEMSELEAREQIISARMGIDPDGEDRRRLAALEQESARLEKELKKNIVNLVPPHEMPVLLKELLTRQARLQLISLENLAPEQLSFTDQENEEGKVLKLYRHSLRMTFTGDYLTLLQYLKDLEKLPRTLIWEEVEIVSDEYPRSTVRLQVYTLSLREGWIGG